MSLAAMEELQGIAFLHLSDLHFSKVLPRDHKSVLDRLLDDLDSLLKKQKISLDFILLSGDIGFSGKAKEYRTGAEYLTRILECTKVSQDNVIIVPGNHDVDRKMISPVLRSEFTTQNELDRLFSDKRALSLVCRKFVNFRAFLDDFLGQNKHGFRPDHPFYCRTLEIRGRRIGIAALNSALNSQQDLEYGRLVLGECQVQKAIDEIESSGFCDLKMAMFHHPLNFFSAFDSEIIKPLLIKNFDMILNGHMHGMETSRIETPDASVQLLSAGSGYDSRSWHNSYNIVAFDFATKAGVFFIRRWNREAEGRWAAYSGRYDGQDESGKLPFDLHKKKSSHNSIAVAQFEARLHENRILQQLAPMLIEEQKALENDDGYVPLTFSREYGSQSDARPDLENYLDEWIERKDEGAAYLLGGYGAGKSRFLRHYAAILSQRFLHNPDAARVPVLIVLSQRRLLRSFESLLAFTLAEQYGVHFSFNEIKDLVLSGRIVLLLDGFDELALGTDSSAVHAGIKELSVLQKNKSKMIISTRSGYLLANPELRRGLASTPASGGHGMAASKDNIIPYHDNIDSECLYLQELDEKQVQLFIDSYPTSDQAKKQKVHRLTQLPGALREMSRRPVILKLLLDCDVEVLSGKGITHVSDFYKQVTETWISRELERQGVADETRKVAESMCRIIESIACWVLDTGTGEIDKHVIDEIAQSAVLQAAVGENVSKIMDWLSSSVFIEATATGNLRFKHRSFTEFFMACHILRMIKQGEIPKIGEQLPSIEILDFLRDLFDEESADRALTILKKESVPTSVRVALMIALRSLPGGLEGYLRTCISNPSEDFGIKRVAAMSLAENDMNAAYSLAQLLSSDRKAQNGNLAFLRGLWKADNAEIIRRTRYRLSNMDKSDRRYWKNGRCIHMATLGQLGGENEAEFLKVFLGDLDPQAAYYAEKAIEAIKKRISPEARSIDRRLELAFQASREAGKVLMRRFRNDNPVRKMDLHDVTTQADIDAQNVILTIIRDAFPEDAILAEESPAIDDTAPDVYEYRWIVDPLDGSVNFYAGLERFAVAIAIERCGELQASLVYSPTTGDTYWARSQQGAFLGDIPIAVNNAGKAAGVMPPPLVAYATSRHSISQASELGGRLFAEITARFRSMRLFGSASLDFCDLASGRFDCLVKILPAPPWDLSPGLLLVREADGVDQTIHGSSPQCDSLVVAASCVEVLKTLESAIKGLGENHGCRLENDTRKLSQRSKRP
jgi:fructose-1,6-bisphosphatase/inositol monophosphatase family enzyme